MFAGDGAEAVALACGIEFDMVLMDPALRVLDGPAATREIRQFESERGRARVPVVVYTHGHLNEPLLRSFGVDATLEKPCTAPELRRCLSDWVPCESAHVSLRAGDQEARTSEIIQQRRAALRV